MRWGACQGCWPAGARAGGEERHFTFVDDVFRVVRARAAEPVVPEDAGLVPLEAHRLFARVIPGERALHATHDMKGAGCDRGGAPCKEARTMAGQ